MRRWMALALAAWPATGMAAGSILIAPTTVQFDPARHSAAVTVTNDSDEPIDLQFRAYAWVQAAGGEQLTPTDDLAVSPPIATVAPHGRQMFRVLDTTGAGSAPATERSYRLRLNQIPRTAAARVAINLEFSLPVFLTPVGGAARPAWTSEGGTLRVVNAGTRRLRIASLVLHTAHGEVPLPAAAASYVLAGARRSFALPPTARGVTALHLTGATDSDPIDVSIPAVPAP